MKRFWLVLLSLGLIVAFSTQAMAVDVKFSGEYYAAGLYMDRTTLVKDTGADGPSTAFYFQRLRLNTTFIVHPGLMLITRADIMERAWGAARTAPGTALDTLSAATTAENENIGWDLAYAMYISPVGIFLAGYQIDGAWGTVFGDNSLPTGKIGYMFRGGPVTLGIQTGKNMEMSKTAKYATMAADRDSSFLTMYGIYGWKAGQVGLLGKYIRAANNRDMLGFLVPNTGYKTDVVVFLPYLKAKLGPVALQAELVYLWGKLTWEGSPALVGQVDKDMSELAGWIDATADFGKFYVGGTFAYMGGDDPATADKLEGGLTGGLDWNPCLIMFNSDLQYWAGNQAGYSGTANGAPMANAYFLQARAGVRPVDKLDIGFSFSWAHADKTLAATWVGRDYGYEIDATATYKITNNLSYMLGGGYFFVGDWYKGSTTTFNNVSNNFLVINKLTLTF